MLRLGLSLPIEESGLTANIDGLIKHAAKILGLDERDIISLSPMKRSLDARKGRPFLYIWSVDITLCDLKREKQVFGERKSSQLEFIESEKPYNFPISTCQSKKRPVIVGFGPAGLFCALMLARAGLNPIILERGSSVDERVHAVDTFFKDKILYENSNIQFGEGGAGTFSDGKLNTLVKDKNFRGYFILQELVKAGAPDDILYINKPHIGTDRLREVVKNIRKEIISLGGEVMFNTRLIDITIENGIISSIIFEFNGIKGEIKADTLFLGTGHSARDIFSILENKSVPMERKPFSVGVRIEHLQSEIDKTQYRNYAGNPYLPPSDYKLVYHTKNGRALYTFCMCPGGTVIAAASENGGIVTNGMSYHARDGKNANSALLVTVQPQDLQGDSLFAGVELQRQLEKKAFQFGGGDFRAPSQCVGDFLERRPTTTFGIVKPSYSCGVTGCDLNKLLPSFISDTLHDGLGGLNTLLKGFANPEAVLTAPESRSTSPIRIIRGDDMQSSIKGLYPIGEGAGYAGGIMSAAIDGIKAAESYCEM